ncbi:MAG: tRNA (adenosine(37)-N6)-threonylcarbamoyltransferase complex ATPase subunit type 1 TsaE [Planctomycetota bacterium]|nr:tRNA (adenosine(37)-N6)-threonylcarbamoyltransferase complex ATPase subunit type 1 TsaE [Planctomycetota bacterium]
MRERTWISRDPEATEALGEAIGRRAAPGLVVALDGDLGAGKTCFVRGLARGLDVEATVSSPTYALMASYAGRLPLHHFDAWMEGRERAFLADGGAEWLDGRGVAAVEWSGRVVDALPSERLEIALSHVGPAERRVRAIVRGSGERADRLARILAELPAIPGLDTVP